MSNDFFGHTSAIPRPPENPAVEAERQRRMAADLAKGQRETEATLDRARALRAEFAERQEAIRQTAVETSIAALKEQKRQGYRAAGVSDTEFERRWPDLLRAIQDEIAAGDPLESEKVRIRNLSNYSM